MRRNNAGVSILIIEDDPHMRSALRRWLGRHFPALPVSEAENARTGLAHCRREPPSLVLMDVGLPDGNGIQLTAHVRAMSPRTQVIIVSTEAEPRDVAAAALAGAASYVRKDQIAENLLAAVGSALTHSYPKDQP